MCSRYRSLQVFLIIFSLYFTACTKYKVEEGQVLHIASVAKIKGLDPAYASDVYAHNEVERIYEGLLQYHYLKRPYVLEPLLAESMPNISQNGLVYTFKIRKGVFFHNDPAFPGGKGRELEAKDFVYSIQRIADPKIQSEGWWLFENRLVGLDEWRAKMKQETNVNYDEEIAGMRALDKYTLRFELKKPFPQFLYALAMTYAVAVPREVVEKYGKEFINHGVGTGPFILEKFRPNELIAYVKNPNYRDAYYPSEGTAEDKAAGLLDDAGKKIPFIDRIEVRVIIEDQPRWMHFLKGELDLTGIPKDNFSQAINPDKKLTDQLAKKGISLDIAPSLDLTYTAFNLESDQIPQFKDKRVRQAIALALDEQKVINLFYNGMAVLAQSPIPPGIAGAAEANEKNPFHTRDLAKAKQLLAAAGYPEGKGFPEITYDTTSGTTSRQMSELVVQDLAAIGIKVKINSSNWPEFQSRVQKRQVQLWGIAWLGDYPDAENFLQLFYGPNAQPGGMNGSYYKNPKFDQLFEKARAMQDSPARTIMYKQLAQMIVEDEPVVLGAHRLAVGLTQPWLKNYKYHESASLAKYVRIDRDEKKKRLE